MILFDDQNENVVVLGRRILELKTSFQLLQGGILSLA